MLVAVETRGAVTQIALQNPPVNALSAPLLAELDEAVAGAEDDAVRAVIVTGAPRFAAGADISRFQEAFDEGGSGAMLGDELSRVCRRLERLAKPTIAAIRGYAFGGGLELALSCDFRILCDDARVGQPEVALGLLPGAGGTQRLPRLIGLQPARELVLSGRHVAAEEAVALGIVDRVVAPEELDDVAWTEAERWAQGPTKAIGFAKRALYEGPSLPLDEALALESAMFAEAFRTEDAREGITAFLEKRSAEFKGR